MSIFIITIYIISILSPFRLIVPHWRLIFDDEFNISSLDTDKWNVEDSTPRGYHNCCLRYGVQFFTPQALSLVNGTLQITTRKQNIGSHAYTSGAVTTDKKFSFLYGRVDIRVKLPKTQGMWPALWLLPNGSKGIAPFEIDMMELLGKDPKTVYMTNHWGRTEIGGHYRGPDFSQSYHVFSIIWTPQTVTWYIDSIQRFQTSRGVSNQKMYIIINSSLGGRWPGNPDMTTVLPQYMNIDYVRVYQTAFTPVLYPSGY